MHVALCNVNRIASVIYILLQGCVGHRQYVATYRRCTIGSCHGVVELNAWLSLYLGRRVCLLYHIVIPKLLCNKLYVIWQLYLTGLDLCVNFGTLLELFWLHNLSMFIGSLLWLSYHALWNAYHTKIPSTCIDTFKICHRFCHLEWYRLVKNLVCGLVEYFLSLDFCDRESCLRL